MAIAPNSLSAIAQTILKICPVPSTANPEKSQPQNPDAQQQRKRKTKIETIDKLRQFGLSNEQIEEIL